MNTAVILGNLYSTGRITIQEDRGKRLVFALIGVILETLCSGGGKIREVAYLQRGGMCTKNHRF
jgi:hypothetical protein